MSLTFDLNTSIDEIGERLSTVYSHVGLARFPMYRWLQILNDASILAEEVRRNRRDEATDRAGKTLMRILDFLGYYLKTHKSQKGKSFADFLSRVLRMKSYQDYYNGAGPVEGPTRWILAKYPMTCAKCGGGVGAVPTLATPSPCVCVVYPWIFENRREKPGPFELYRGKADDLRKKLAGEEDIPLFTLPQLIAFFRDIYRSSYHHQDSWKLVMHLAEELGEATTELSRLELIYLAEREGVELPVKRTRNQAKDNFAAKIDRIDKTDPQFAATKSRAEKKLQELYKELTPRPPWDVLYRIVGEQFKEEIADVFSWLSAVLCTLTDNDEDKLGKHLETLRERYVPKSGEHILKCPYCHQKKCGDGCLVSHAAANELVEKAFHL
jgi:hypothetical protein